ncbi:hypothetical protein BS732_2566 [Bacillus subtilis MB73/2]|nr:hypothetical protein BS732_2566 [Bacillus subtilis MB73/2]
MIATSIMIMIKNIMITTKSMMTMIKSITMITIIITKKSIMMTMIIIMILSNHIKNITKSLKRLFIPWRHTGGFFMIFIDELRFFCAHGCCKIQLLMNTSHLTWLIISGITSF